MGEKLGTKKDRWINLGLLIVTGCGMLGGFFSAIDSRYTHADVTAERIIKRAVIDDEFRAEFRQLHEENHQMRDDIHQIYLQMAHDR